MGSKRRSSRSAAEAVADSEPGTLRRYTPEERRAAVEAYEKSGLTQALFARQWGVSHVTLGFWLKRHREAGARGLERVSSAPPRRRGKAPLAEPVRAEIVATKRRFPAFGLRKVRDFLVRFSGIHALLRREGWRVNKKRVARLWREEGLQVPVRKRKRRRLGHSKNSCQRRPATAKNEVWCYDFVFDRTEDGRRLKFLTIVDE